MTARADPPLRFSVIVASRSRPTWLRRCLSGLRQLDYPEFEIILVADPESLVGIDTPNIKTVPYDTANLAAARNIGIAHAAGDLCAFIDDDAVPEPLWLRHLADAFHATSSAAVVGFVRGRNGISYQSELSSVDDEAETHEETVEGDIPTVPVLGKRRAVKLVGTNMAVRLETLVRVGGFDEAFRFFLEDSDISLRLGHDGARMAVAPLAQVHHGFAPSKRRTRLRAPLDLFDIGRSTSHYLCKHMGAAGDELWLRLEDRERRRLLRHMVAGTCEPQEVSRRLERLRAGWEEGTLQKPTLSSASAPETIQFLRYPSLPEDHRIYASQWVTQRASLLKQAAKQIEEGGRASVFSFSLTPVRHRIRYVDAGFWLQTGGVFGKSDRTDPAFRWCRFADRLKREISCVAKIRGIRETAKR